MSKFIVSIPIAGSISIKIEADDAESAEAEAWQAFDESGAEEFELEWEALRAITTGNVLHASLNKVSVTKIKEPKP